MTQNLDGIGFAVATIMTLDRAIRNQGNSSSVYDDRGTLVL